MNEQEHYFTADPASAQQRRELAVDLVGRRVTVETAPGVFCPDRLDLGTSVLLREVPDPPEHGDLLDLGCGWGPVTLTLATLSPEATVWGVDVNRRALDLTARNAARLALENVRTSEPDDVPGDLRFGTIWSNPPIRVGKAVLHDMLLQWLPRLLPGGTAYLVVQKNLGADSLHAWLGGTLGSRFATSRLASAKGFRVLAVHHHLAPDEEPA
ncbi:class I SAM-dependent methyltransferase [Mobilicoccus massiliensis]|uniref:class I SAM-dependent methyltransferase n=1 Tax=Mobilicoccus massiliensis TaxID=1522310 RepID=UPI0005914D9E|nr:methyltransferase [Mobilicoccus massiliensis]